METAIEGTPRRGRARARVSGYPDIMPSVPGRVQLDGLPWRCPRARSEPGEFGNARCHRRACHRWTTSAVRAPHGPARRGFAAAGGVTRDGHTLGIPFECRNVGQHRPRADLDLFVIHIRPARFGIPFAAHIHPSQPVSVCLQSARMHMHTQP